ncbi:hypothetical protein [Janthinobacterium sp. P210006]|uniref:hypothetical protein n=1 Tax=Janthinobacterium sp. P210006 TaxID=3112939 RepID=UPI002E26A5A1|nr:hypothetical protein [Janthinobacterium sp. P210006]
MFELYFLSIAERFYGIAIPGMIARTGVVSERTIRNWLNGKAVSGDRERDAFVRRSMSWLEKELIAAKWPKEKREAYLSQIAENCGGASAIIQTLHWGNPDGCPATLDLSRRIDALSLALGEQRERNDMAGFVQLFHTAWLKDEHFKNPELKLGPAALRESTNHATQWADLAMPTAVLLLNLQLQLLATLDHEFSARYLPKLEPVPVFHGLFPARTVRKSGGPRTRGRVRLPVRKLLDMMACLRYYRIHGKWPAHIPSVSDSAIWMDVLPPTLVKWRMGRQFTVNDFDSAWLQMFNRFPEHSRPSPPVPLLYAAVVLTRLFVIGSVEKNNLSIAEGGAELYLEWWARQRETSETHLGAQRAGVKTWMSDLL